MELSMATTGIPLFDMAVELLALRTIASGVFSESVSVFEGGSRRAALGSVLVYEDRGGQRFVMGPGDEDLLNFPFDMNSEGFPSDP
jgi:hypothetical protein